MKKMHLKNKAMSFLLSFSMVVSLFAVPSIAKQEAKAAETSEATIELGELTESSDNSSYSYPNAQIKNLPEETEFSSLSISVDSGYFKAPKTKLDSIAGQGIAAGDEMNANYQKLTENGQYEAVYYTAEELGDSISYSSILDCIQTIQFTTAPNKSQKIHIHAVTAGNYGESNSITLEDGRSIDLYYFNGHYYGLVPIPDSKNDKSWTEAYRESKTITFHGVKGYLATLTSRAEDRFLLKTFALNQSNYATPGWIGCTRAILADSSKYEDANTEWKALDSFDFENCEDKFIWRWASGPEAGTAFGYQNHAYGDGTWGDGGFVTYDGFFSNWNKDGNIEPNGGGYTTEAYGYFGKYEYGRWNDAKNSGGGEYNINHYYIEFGGGIDDDGIADDDKLAETTGKIDIFAETGSDNPITNATPEPVVQIEGKPQIVNKNVDAEQNPINEVGTVLSADISGVQPKGGRPEDIRDVLSYQWAIKNDDGTLDPIDQATDQNLTLDESLLDKEIVVTVSVNNDRYEGSSSSEPYDTTATEVVEEEKIAIAGNPVIKNETKDDGGNEIKKEGSVLTADIKSITPISSHDSLTYQWYIVNDIKKDDNGNEIPNPDNPHALELIPDATEKSLVLTERTVDKKLVVIATAEEDSPYTGKVMSDLYDTTRTNSGVIVETPPEDPDNPDNPDNTKRTITITPTGEDTIYGIKDETGKVLTDLPAVDQDGNEITPNYEEDPYKGYYQVKVGDSITITVDKDKTYVIHEVKLSSKNTEIITPVVPDSNIKTEYDNNGTADTKDDTISIIIDPADTANKYAVLKKVNGKYENVYVKKENGNYVYTTEDTTGIWSDGGEGKVTFTKLPADGTYKIIAIPANTGNDIIDNLTPNDIISGGGGSTDITVPQIPVSPDIPDNHVQETLDNKNNTDPADDTISIVVDPAETNSKYAVLKKDEDGKYTEVGVKKDESGNYVYDPNGTGIWTAGGENKVTFTELPADGTYKIVSIPADTDKDVIDKLTPDGLLSDGGGSRDIHLEDKDQNPGGDNPGGDNPGGDNPGGDNPGGDNPGNIADLVIPDNTIQDSYDNKNTEPVDDDTVSITLNPTDKEYKYTVLKKDEDGKYTEVAISKDEDGKYVYDPDGTQIWTDGNEDTITFTELPADGTYKVVAIPADTSNDVIDSLTPDKLGNGEGGSRDIHPDPVAYTPASAAPSDTPAPTNTAAPSSSTNQTAAPSSSAIQTSTAPGSSFSAEDQNTALQFIKEHATAPDGTIIKEITDITRDIITSGATEWSKMTETQKAAVNEQLRASGCPYTFEELLQMAQKYKIPGFHLRKVMKKGSKAKLKLVKCSGATIVCTTTNKKVATVNKKGLIKAKKVGKATLTVTATKGNHTNRLVVKIVVRKKFKNAKELKKFKSNKIKTPTILIAKKRKVKKSTKLKVYDLEKGAKVQYKAFNKKVLKLTKKGKYTGKKKGSSLVRVTIRQNNKKYFLYVYVTIFKK